MADDDGEWGSIAEAARRLRVTRQAVRGRIRRSTLATRTEVVSNRQRLLVRLPEPIPEPAPAPAQEAELIAELRATIADLRAERDRLLAIIERRPGGGWWRRR